MDRLWNERAFRLDFFHNLHLGDVEIIGFATDLAITVAGEELQPDLLIYAKIEDKIVTFVFEFKFYQDISKIKADWEKILKYKDAGFDYGYVLAITFRGIEKEIPTETQRIDGYEAKALIHVGPPVRYAPGFYLAQELMRKALKMPFHVSVLGDWAATFPQKDYIIFFDFRSKFGKCLVGAYFLFESKSKEFDEIERKLKENGFDNWIILDEDGEIKSSESFKGFVLLDEFEVDVLSIKTYNRIRNRLLELKPVMEGLKPGLSL